MHAVRANPSVDLIISQNDIPGGGSVAIARFVRWEMPAPAKTLPIISLGRDWTPELLLETREAGICEVIAMPTSLMAVQAKLLSAMDGKRPFISTATYRGRCRRRRSSKGYQGPFRRAEDRIAEQLNQAVEKSERRAIRQDQQGERSPPPVPTPGQAAVVQQNAASSAARPRANEVEVEEGGDRQTRAVIDKAFVTTRLIEQLLARLVTTTDSVGQATLNTAVADAEERLINLMALVQMRIEQHGCSAADVERLRIIRKSVDASAESLLRAQLSRLIKSGEDLLSGRAGLSFNMGLAMQARMSYAQFLINLRGGLDMLDGEVKDAVDKAQGIVAQVKEIEAGIMPLPQFETARSSKLPTSERSGPAGR
ncbi:chemotaxis protein CheY [Paramagnetospirillum kuznetsovii]|nr:chemotaxis protein CheY [Paramagnetospirillum kuznetsovii]